MKPHELRLAQEHVKMVRHLRNLTAFIESPERFSQIDRASRALMRRQADLLEEYISVLEQRMQILNIPL